MPWNTIRCSTTVVTPIAEWPSHHLNCNGQYETTTFPLLRYLYKEPCMLTRIPQTPYLVYLQKILRGHVDLRRRRLPWVSPQDDIFRVRWRANHVNWTLHTCYHSRMGNYSTLTAFSKRLPGTRADQFGLLLASQPCMPLTGYWLCLLR